MPTSKCSPLDTAGLGGAGRRRANRRRLPGDSWEVASWSICQRLLSDLLAVAEHAARLDVVTGGLLYGRSLYPRGAGPTLTITQPNSCACPPTTGDRHDELGECCAWR